MTLRSTQPLTEMSNMNISWGVKAAGAYGWQPYHLHVSTVLKSGCLNLLETSGPAQACNGIVLPLHCVTPLHAILIKSISLWNNSIKIFRCVVRVSHFSCGKRKLIYCTDKCYQYVYISLRSTPDEFRFPMSSSHILCLIFLQHSQSLLQCL
jgi:hypothetical protein